MNAMQRDLQDLGLRLWPDDTALGPRRSLGARGSPGLRSRLAAVAIGAFVFVLVFGVIALSIILSHTPAKTSTVATKPANAVVRVEISVPVPGNPLTFEVARGATLAMHLHFNAPRPSSAWGVGTNSNASLNAIQVPYPGSHPASTFSDFYVAFRFPSVGTTQISILVPVSCFGTASCPPPEPQNITVHTVVPPIRTATVTGELITYCPPPITSVPASCSEPQAGATITFRNQDGRTVGATADAEGDYFAELPPGTWKVATVPSAVPGQGSSITVAAGDIVVDDIKVMACQNDAPTSANRC